MGPDSMPNSAEVKIEPWMTVSDVAFYLQISAENVREKARLGILPAHKLGKFWRFRRVDIDQYLVNLNSSKQ